MDQRPDLADKGAPKRLRVLLIGNGVGTKMVRSNTRGSVGRADRDIYNVPAQSIIGATLNRREGSGRVVCGVKAVSKGILVYAFLYHLPGV